jgi:hypothetical protein
MNQLDISECNPLINSLRMLYMEKYRGETYHGLGLEKKADREIVGAITNALRNELEWMAEREG